MNIIIAIGAGSFIGGMLRFLISGYLQTKHVTNFPIGTLAVNIIGCFIIGIVYGLADRGNMSHEWRLFLSTGLLGGFTTFSAFSIDIIGMLRNDQFLSAASYVGASVVLGLIVAMMGIFIIKSI